MLAGRNCIWRIYRTPAPKVSALATPLHRLYSGHSPPRQAVATASSIDTSNPPSRIERHGLGDGVKEGSRAAGRLAARMRKELMYLGDGWRLAKKVEEQLSKDQF